MSETWLQHRCLPPRSATTWLEKAHAFTSSLSPVVLPAGVVSTFPLSEIQSITWQPQTGVNGVNYNQQIPLTGILNGVETISFGLFLSPLYLSVAGPQAGTIPTTPTNLPIAPPTLIEPVSYHVFLPPASARPAAGFPVIIYGHGLDDKSPVRCSHVCCFDLGEKRFCHPDP